jgi:lipopolysaccharide transport system permease protein
MVAYKVSPTGKLWYLPGIILWQGLFCCGLGMTLGIVHVYFRDTGPLVETALGMWFYATPVFYATDLMSEKVRMLYYLNPTAVMVELYRWSVLAKPFPPVFHVIAWAAGTVLLLLIGFRSYERHGVQVPKLL